MMRIERIVCALPARTVTNDDLARENPSWDAARLEAMTGVARRGIAGDTETALDIAYRACDELLAAPGTKESIGGIIFCTQSPDYIMPANSCILHGHYDFPEQVLAFDINHACSGYLYSLQVARGLLPLIHPRKILLVTGDTYSKYIHKQDRSARVLFGDGASASLLGPADTGGIIDIICATGGKEYDKFIVTAGACRMPHSAETARPITDPSGNVRTLEHIAMDGMGILRFVNSRVPAQIRALLERNKLTLEDIDLFIFHQASKMALDSLTRLLHLRPEKVFTNLRDVGNTVSTSIPLALHQAHKSGLIRPGQRIILSGFGVGLSWATALMEA